MYQTFSFCEKSLSLIISFVLKRPQVTDPPLKDQQRNKNEFIILIDHISRRGSWTNIFFSLKYIHQQTTKTLTRKLHNFRYPLLVSIRYLWGIFPRLELFSIGGVCYVFLTSRNKGIIAILQLSDFRDWKINVFFIMRCVRYRIKKVTKLVNIIFFQAVQRY